MGKINKEAVANNSVKAVGRPRKDMESPSPITPSPDWNSLSPDVISAQNGAFAALFCEESPIGWCDFETDEEQDIVKFTGQNDSSNFAHKYVMYGPNNLLPAEIAKKIANDETMLSSINTLKNICYGNGVAFCIDENENDNENENKADARKARKEAEGWFDDNDVQMLALQQAKNLKTYAWDLTVIVLSNDGKTITDIYSRDVAEVRLHPHLKGDVRYEDDVLRCGTIPFAYYGKFNCQMAGDISNVEVIRLLDERNPLRDLKVKMGMERNPMTGQTKSIRCRKFGILRRIPTVEKHFYPLPSWAGVLKGNWYHIKKQIELSLLAKIKNTAQIRYVVNINPEYWARVAAEAGVVEGPTSAKGKALIAKKKQEILDYLCGNQNDSKPWISTMYRNPATGEVSDMIKITTVDTKTQGGDWSEDISESCNMLCYGVGVHPSLVGAVPGKAGSQTSGTDKRELHTIAQAAETPTRNIMMMAYNVVLGFMGWKDRGVKAHIPFMQLTGLDEHKSAKEVVPTPNS